MRSLMTSAAVSLSSLLTSCLAVTPVAHSPVPLVASVDLPRFMGDWYVIAHIPSFIDKTAHNAVENYVLRDDGLIATTYTYRKDQFDGPAKKMTPVARVIPGTGHALWGMQFVWPIEGEYRIAHLEPDYSVMIVGRSKLDYVWLMSRQPTMTAADYARYSRLMASWGYDTTKLVAVPQSWPQKL